MTAEEYTRKRMFLLAALKDAVDRGDYHLEMDVREKLIELQDRIYNEENEE